VSVLRAKWSLPENAAAVVEVVGEDTGAGGDMAAGADMAGDMVGMAGDMVGADTGVAGIGIVVGTAVGVGTVVVAAVGWSLVGGAAPVGDSDPVAGFGYATDS
jgi:hypothetical protein